MSVTAFEIFTFIRQVGFALVGASSLWGLYYYYKKCGSEGEARDVFSEITEKLLEPVSFGILLSLVGWFSLSWLSEYTVLGHEGITVEPEVADVVTALDVTEPFFFALLSLFFAGMLVKYERPRRFAANSHLFYGAWFILSAVLLSVPVWTGRVDSEKLFFIGHNFHSILTLGTVLVLDFVMLISKYHERYERYLYPTLPTISKVIWLGLAIDFVSVYFAYDQAIANTAKFQFMQTVIAVVIINGIFLSGPVTRKMINAIKPDRVEELSNGWQIAASLSGALSIASWTTVTFTDVLKGVDASYTTLLGFYIIFIIVTFMIYEVMEHYKVGSRW